MTVAEVKIHLKKFGTSTRGRKAELVERQCHFLILSPAVLLTQTAI